VFTDRHQDATTLQALELVNGAALRQLLAHGAKRMLGQVPPAPANLYDSGRVSGNMNTTILDRTITARLRTVDIDLSGVSDVRLLIVDAGSYSPERVRPVWVGAVLSGANGETPLSSLRPKSGEALQTAVRLSGQVYPDALAPGLASELVYAIGGQGYTRLQAKLGLDDECLQSDISPAVRFFVFKEQPDLERLVQVEPGVPAPSPLRNPFTRDSVIFALFQAMLGRPPSVQEQRLASQALPARVTSEGLADLLWAMAMQPEFQLIY
jgi:hypothetical protein